MPPPAIWLNPAFLRSRYWRMVWKEIKPSVAPRRSEKFSLPALKKEGGPTLCQTNGIPIFSDQSDLFSWYEKSYISPESKHKSSKSSSINMGYELIYDVDSAAARRRQRCLLCPIRLRPAFWCQSRFYLAYKLFHLFRMSYFYKCSDREAFFVARARGGM